MATWTRRRPRSPPRAATRCRARPSRPSRTRPGKPRRPPPASGRRSGQGRAARAGREAPVSGQQVSLLGRTLRMVRAGTPVVVGERLGEGGQGVVHAVTIGGAPYAVKWYRYASPELRRNIEALIERGRPHRDFCWPI